MRDSQRSKVYSAERLYYGPASPVIGFEEAEKLAQEIRPELRVDKGRLGARSWAWPNRIYLGNFNGTWVTVDDGWGYRRKATSWATTRWVVIHECAHVLQYRKDRGKETAAHGPQFCRTYLDLVQKWDGWDARQLLAKGFGEKRVKVA